MIKYNDLSRPYLKHKDEFDAIYTTVLQTGQFFLGDKTEDFEQTICELTNRRYSIAVGSGSDALYFIIRALNLSGKILLPAFTYVATAHSVVNAGCTPVYVDVDEMGMIDIGDAEQKITKDCVALISVPMFGNLPDYDKINDLCNKHNLYLLDDNAQSFCSTTMQGPGGSWGIASALSFDPLKPFGSFGGGGAVVTNDHSLYNKIKMMRHQGKDNNVVNTQGYNSKMSELDCAVVSFKLTTDEHIERQKVYNQYVHLLDHTTIMKNNEQIQHNAHKLVIKTDYRDQLQNYLSGKEIETRAIWPRPIYKEPYFSGSFNCRVTEQLCQSTLSLPCYPYLSEDEILYVVNSIKEFFSN